MALQIRRGTQAELDLLSPPPAEGELIYTTDNKQLYVGDGITNGGILVSQNLNDLLTSITTDTNILSLFNGTLGGSIRLSTLDNLNNHITVGSTGTTISGPFFMNTATVAAIRFSDGSVQTTADTANPDQSVNTTSNVKFNSIDIATNASISGQLTFDKKTLTLKDDELGRITFDGRLANSNAIEGARIQINARRDFLSTQTFSSIALMTADLNSTLVQNRATFDSENITFTAKTISASTAPGGQQIFEAFDTGITFGGAGGYTIEANRSNALLQLNSLSTNNIQLDPVNQWIDIRRSNVYSGNNLLVRFGTETSQFYYPGDAVGSPAKLDITAIGVKIDQNLHAGNYLTNVTTTATIDIFGFESSSYNSGKFCVQVKDNGDIHFVEINIVTDGSDVWKTEYGTNTSNGALGTFSVAMQGSLCKLQFTPSSATSMNIRVSATLLAQ